MKIIDIKKSSIGSKVGLLPGDVLKTINHRPLRDLIDYRFYASDESFSLLVQRGEETFEINIEKHPDEDLGLELEPIHYKSCKNNCVFCFIDQLPPGMRPPLYFKDEDYRLSFLQGTYITLTGISKEDLDRIIEFHLSPLFVSVHTTDPLLRSKLMRGQDVDELMNRIEYLTQGNIELHTQIVLCPGLNDGRHLEKTIKDLMMFYPHVRSVAIVPVGLTRHRKNLHHLQGVDSQYARKFVNCFQPWQEVFRRTIGETFLHFGDEFYLLADINIPETMWYDDFPQIENGVGMVRQLFNTFLERKDELPREIEMPMKATIVTGKLASRLFENQIIPTLNKIRNLHVRTALIPNRFLGESVTVSGLLTGVDILETVGERERDDVILLPPNCLNDDGLFLDDMTVEELAEKLHTRICVGSYDIVETLNDLFRQHKIRGAVYGT
ncbi:MAG: DUF512 domain-containing protein [Gemmatimonadota bacterium]|nr:MAG: DUF512 domain-containing protein [Gemmatimonadota bacterium]